MSRSNPALTNPAQYFMSWSGSTGTLSWYNKEKKQNIPVRLPFRFLVLDQLATIKGYNKPAKAGYWSNEVRNTRKEELHVRLGNQSVFVGLYKNEQDIVQVPKGADYTQSVYIAHVVNDEWVISNINMKGSARSAWFDFTNGNKVENGTVIMSKGDVQEAQTGEFYPPKFDYESSTPEEDTKAIELDKQLQVYLSQYLAAGQHGDSEVEVVEDTHDPSEQPGDGFGSQEPVNMPANAAEAVDSYQERTKNDDAPKRDWNKVGKKSADVESEEDQKAMDAYIDTIQGEPISTDEIPF